MKYCEKCGAELLDEAVICPKCGCQVSANIVVNSNTNDNNSTLKIITKVFMVLGCITTGLTFFAIPFIWTIPMTVHYFTLVRERRPISTGFKVCSLLFVSLIGGILMLCDKDNNEVL